MKIVLLVGLAAMVGTSMASCAYKGCDSPKKFMHDKNITNAVGYAVLCPPSLEDTRLCVKCMLSWEAYLNEHLDYDDAGVKRQMKYAHSKRTVIPPGWTETGTHAEVLRVWVRWTNPPIRMMFERQLNETSSASMPYGMFNPMLAEPPQSREEDADTDKISAAPDDILAKMKTTEFTAFFKAGIDKTGGGMRRMMHINKICNAWFNKYTDKCIAAFKEKYTHDKQKEWVKHCKTLLRRRRLSENPNGPRSFKELCDLLGVDGVPL